MTQSIGCPVATPMPKGGTVFGLTPRTGIAFPVAVLSALIGGVTALCFALFVSIYAVDRESVNLDSTGTAGTIASALVLTLFVLAAITAPEGERIKTFGVAMLLLANFALVMIGLLTLLLLYAGDPSAVATLVAAWAG